MLMGWEWESNIQPVTFTVIRRGTCVRTGLKKGTECFHYRFSLPTLMCAGYSVKLKKITFSPVIGELYCMNLF